MDKKYANLPMRIKAAVLDSIILIAAMFVISEVLSLFENVPDYIRGIIAGFLFLFYDPIFTHFKGGTIGHMFSNITVRSVHEESKNINFFNAILRFVIKLMFGWISLLSVTGHEKRRALHDLAAGSVVLDLDETSKPD